MLLYASGMTENVSKGDGWWDVSAQTNMFHMFYVSHLQIRASLFVVTPQRFFFCILAHAGPQTLAMNLYQSVGHLVPGCTEILYI